jgi:hypothetical protein
MSTPQAAQRKQWRARQARYRRRNLKQVRKRDRAWYKAHPARRREWHNSAYKADPSIRIAQVRRRRARKLGNGGSFTSAALLALKTKYGNRCLACGKTERQLKRIGRVLAADHVIPLAPPFSGRNDASNIQPLCHGRGGCNNLKGAKHVDYR